MWLTKIPLFLVTVVYLDVAGCTTAPAGGRERIIELPLSSVESDFEFTITTGFRKRLSCADNSDCPTESASATELRFALQVQRIAGVLQDGAQKLYPDLLVRAPKLARGRFDIYVVESDKPGSTSCANGRISLNAALGTSRPDDAVVAFIIAREMGHVIGHHHDENSSAGIFASVILNIILPGSGLIKTALSTGGSRIAALSRRDVQATEADAVANNLLEASGFSLREVSQSLLGASASLNESFWSKNFMKSSNHLIAEARKSELPVASAQDINIKKTNERLISHIEIGNRQLRADKL